MAIVLFQAKPATARVISLLTAAMTPNSNQINPSNSNTLKHASFGITIIKFLAVNFCLSGSLACGNDQPVLEPSPSAWPAGVRPGQGLSIPELTQIPDEYILTNILAASCLTKPHQYALPVLDMRPADVNRSKYVTSQ